MCNKIPRLLLFDIDGTLTKSAYSKGAESYICKALSLEFAREVHRNGIIFDGGTDGSIAADLLGQYGINKQSCSSYETKVFNAFENMISIMKEGIKNNMYHWERLNNTNEILHQLSQRKDVKLALLTGNHKQTAKLKLENAGIETHHFRWGSYDGDDDSLFGAFGGSDHPVRSELVRIARDRYVNYLSGGNADDKFKVDWNDLLVIGDSPKDITCAHHNNVACVAVDTGKFNANQLIDADIVLEGGFANLEVAIEAILTARR